MYIVPTCTNVHTYNLLYKKNQVAVPKEKCANPGQLFRAFGPHQQGAAQFLPSTAGLNMYMYMYMYNVSA